MAETYDILWENESVGTARMKREGLYCCFCCRCRQPDQGLYRIHVVFGEKRVDLGICVPMDGAFGMDKKLPTKRLGEGAPVFELLPKDWKPSQIPIPEPPMPESEEPPTPEIVEETSDSEQAEGLLVPVSEEEPFGYLDRLENAVLAEQDGQPGILIQESTD